MNINKKNINEIKNDKYNICKCGKRKLFISVQCSNCSKFNQRRVERPKYEILIDEIKKDGYSFVGRKYGVSDNSIRKWIKYYEKNIIS